MRMAKQPKARATQTKGKSANAKPSPDREQRWDEIIHAAASIFYEKGYEATSLQDIASAVGLLKGSIDHSSRVVAAWQRCNTARCGGEAGMAFVWCCGVRR